MPNWIQKAVSGSLTCLFCGSLVTQVVGIWLCLDVNCLKYADLPAEEQRGFVGWINVERAWGTISLPSGLPYSIGTIGKGGEG